MSHDARDIGGHAFGRIRVRPLCPPYVPLSPQTSTHSAAASSAIRVGAIRPALGVEPAAGTTSSNARSDTSQYTGSAVLRPNGQTPPTSWPVISATSSAASIFGLPPKRALTFLLSSRA